MRKKMFKLVLWVLRKGNSFTNIFVKLCECFCGIVDFSVDSIGKNIEVAEFDFKLVEGYDNYTQLGQDYQRFIERADWEKQGELLGGLMDCDDARVYDGRVRRRPAED